MKSTKYKEIHKCKRQSCGIVVPVFVSSSAIRNTVNNHTYTRITFSRDERFNIGVSDKGSTFGGDADIFSVGIKGKDLSSLALAFSYAAQELFAINDKLNKKMDAKSTKNKTRKKA